MSRLAALLLLAGAAAHAAEDAFQAEFVATYCVACHSGANAANGLRLD